MTLLILGLALWCGAHLFKRLAPAARARLAARMGEPAKGLFAAALALSVLLLVLGYRAAPFVTVWTPPPWCVHLNNLLMVCAVALFGTGNSKSRLRGAMRHPMLWGFSLWCVAHLLVNGDAASVLMWGVLLAWAQVQRLLINRAEPAPPAYAGGTLKGDIRLAVITLLIFAVITTAHTLLGVWPFPR